MLDPLHFGGGNTTYEALAVGTPVVTWPSQFLRGRISQALYGMVGMRNCIVDSAETYVASATRLANDRGLRDEIGRQLLESSSAVFNRSAGLRQFEEFVESLREDVVRDGIRG